MKECYQHTDLEWRLSQIPDSAACRGVYFNMLDQQAAAFGARVQKEYRDYFKLISFNGLRLYSIKDYLTRMVKLAALQFGPANIHKGLFEIQEAAWPSWRKTLVGRATFAVLGNDFDAVLRVMGGAVSKSLNHGSCKITKEAAGKYVARFTEQYVYIEHAMAGALTGVARACGVPVTVESQLRDAFNGDVIINVQNTGVT
jgi:uncharacterized protein (TIGR02265 family)